MPETARTSPNPKRQDNFIRQHPFKIDFISALRAAHKLAKSALPSAILPDRIDGRFDAGVVQIVFRITVPLGDGSQRPNGRFFLH